MTDDQIDLLAQTAMAGYFADYAPQARSAWTDISEKQKGDWRRCARAVVRHITGEISPVLNKAPHHMSEDETDLIAYCDEYETSRNEEGRLADATAELSAFRIAEHFALIRRAVHGAPLTNEARSAHAAQAERDKSRDEHLPPIREGQ